MNNTMKIKNIEYSEEDVFKLTYFIQNKSLLHILIACIFIKRSERVLESDIEGVMT